MGRLLTCALAAVAANAFAYGNETKDVKAFSVELGPGQMHEECLRLDPAEKRRYYWKSDAPLDFNIHYHRGPEVFYPVKREGMRTDGGTFEAKAGDDYCWMWTARDKSARLEGRIESK